MSFFWLHGFLLRLDGISNVSKDQESTLKRALSTLRDAAGTGALVLMAGTVVFGTYVFLTSLPDIKRYIKISTM